MSTKRPSSVLDMLSSPQKAKATKSIQPQLCFGRSSTAALSPAKEIKETKKQRASVGGAQGIDAATGKKLQRRVNQKKHAEEEKIKAAELLEANAGKFASLPEEPEEPTDEAEEIEEGAWDVAQRTKEIEVAWGEAVSREEWVDGRIPFQLVASCLENASGRVAALRGIANLFRLVLQASGNKEADLNAVMTLLLASKCKVPTRMIAGAITDAFAMSEKAIRKDIPPEDLADAALSARSKQRQLFRSSTKNVSAVEVSAFLEGVLATQATLCGRGGVLLPDAVGFQAELTRVLGASVAENRETWHLVRVLQGRAGVSWDIAVRGLAHAMVLGPPRSAQSWDGTRVQDLLAMEDAVVQAYAQGVFETKRLIKTLLEGTTAENLVEACGPVYGIPVMPCQFEQNKEIEVSVERIGKNAVFAEWTILGERAQVHIRDGGKEIMVFSQAMEPRQQRVFDVTQVLSGHLNGVDSCILDVVFPKTSVKDRVATDKIDDKPDSKADVVAKPASEDNKENESPKIADDKPLEDQGPAPQNEQSLSGAPALKEQIQDQDRQKPCACMIMDLIMLNGTSLTMRSFRERRAEMERIVQTHPLLRLGRGDEIHAENVDVATATAKLDEALGAVYLCDSDEKVFSRAYSVVLRRLDGAGSVYIAGRRNAACQALMRPPITGREADRQLFECLSEEEKKLLPAVEEFHFTVISGFRTRTVEGIKDILNIQKLYSEAGVSPTWYVDNECPEEYRKLGLKVVKAGKLIPARNHALEDAQKLGKVCVQTSDDIGNWCYLKDERKHLGTDEESNAACKRCPQLHVSPVAAARFICTKMRARGTEKCKLGGVYPLGNGGRSMRAEPFSRYNFILGDFFVSELSPVRFDERLSLKEDYDFTASHLEAFGEALRCNRMIITAKHETNAGGACDVRDAAGEKEKYNIKILLEKWPGAIKDHPTRANQIVLRFKSLKRPVKDATPEKSEDKVGEAVKDASPEKPEDKVGETVKDATPEKSDDKVCETVKDAAPEKSEDKVGETWDAKSDDAACGKSDAKVDDAARDSTQKKSGDKVGDVVMETCDDKTEEAVREKPDTHEQSNNNAGVGELQQSENTDSADVIYIDHDDVAMKD